MEFYAEAKEDILNNLPNSKGPKVRMTVFISTTQKYKTRYYQGQGFKLDF
jgi:hypothetical protein